MQKISSYIDELYKQAKVNDDVEYNKFQKRVLDNPSGSVLVAHPVGSGKTLTGTAKFEKLKSEGRANKALVVTPAGLRNNFGTEGIKKFTNSKYNIIGNKQEISKKIYKDVDPNSDYNIISYEMFRKNPEKWIKETGADTLIVDEFHRLRNEGTSTGDSFKKVRPNVKNFIGLTGSVANNGIADVQPLVDLVSGGEHNLGKDKDSFSKHYLKKNSNGPYAKLADNRKPVVGFNNKKKLVKDLSKYIDYTDVDEVRPLAKIPKQDAHMVKVPISKQQAKLYKKLVSESPELQKLIYKKRLETLKDDEIARAWNKLNESRKLMNSVGSVVPGISLKESANITPKTKRLLDDLDNHLHKTKDGQAILLTNLINGGSDVLEAGLKERGIDYGKFLGKGNKDVTEESRQKDVKDYLKGKKKVMIISGAGAEGLSLGNTTWEGMLDPHYNPERMNQMEARGIRAYGLSHRPESQRVVETNRYIATMPKTLGIFKSRYKTPDEIVNTIAENKDKQNQLLFELLKKNQGK